MQVCHNKAYLGPTISDIPEVENQTIATFADDTAILAKGNVYDGATKNYNYPWTHLVTRLENAK